MVDWYFYFGFKEKEHEYLYREINVDDIILDVGSNIGLVAVQMSAIAEKGEVHAFEPFSKNHARLMEHISMNNIKNIIPNNLGMSDKSETVAMSSPNEENSGMTRVDPDADGDLPLTTIDDYCKRAGIQKLDLIKMDIEGYEAKALHGGKEVLKNLKPTLFIELDDSNLRKYGDSAKDLVLFLEENGYECIDCTNGQSIQSKTDFSDLHIDILAKQTLD
jgi:FkbM family methyltransferase